MNIANNRSDLEEHFFNIQDISVELLDRYKQIKGLFESHESQMNIKNAVLTDHGIKHIHKVQDIIYRLAEKRIQELNHHEIYTLCCTSILHDWGNIYGRKDHQLQVQKACNKAFTNHTRDQNEIMLFHNIVASHCGVSRLGTKDTINDIDENGTMHNGKRIRSRLVAALLKLSDELAECPERTSATFIESQDLPEESLMHHFYASHIKIEIDNENSNEQSIAIALHIPTYKDNNEIMTTALSSQKKVPLETYLKFVTTKINKTNDERLYTNFYFDNFIRVKDLTANIRFYKTDDSNTNLEASYHTDTKRFDDKIIPGSQTYNLQEFNFEEISKKFHDGE